MGGPTPNSFGLNISRFRRITHSSQGPVYLVQVATYCSVNVAMLLLLPVAYVSVIVCNVVVSKSCHLLWCKCYYVMLLLLHVAYVSVILCNVVVSKSCHYAVV